MGWHLDEGKTYGLKASQPSHGKSCEHRIRATSQRSPRGMWAFHTLGLAQIYLHMGKECNSRAPHSSFLTQGRNSLQHASLAQKSQPSLVKLPEEMAMFSAA